MNESPNSPESTRAGARKAYNEEQRSAHLARWQASGLTGVQYARQSGVDRRNLYRWRGKARKGSLPLKSDGGAGAVFMRVDLEQDKAQGCRSAAKRSRRVAGPEGLPQRMQGCALAAMPTVRLRHGELELTVSEAASARQLVEVLAAIRREVLYV